MAKKCIICGEEAIYQIKGTSDFYCEECAEENFDDVKGLERIDEVQKTKHDIEDVMEPDEEILE